MSKTKQPAELLEKRKETYTRVRPNKKEKLRRLEKDKRYQDWASR